MLLKFVQILIFFMLVSKSFELRIECLYGINFKGLYSCFVERLWDVEEPKLTHVNGTHADGMNNEEVKILSISFFHLKNYENGKLKHFPRDIQLFFPKTEVIYISIDNDIAELSSTYLESLTELKEFTIESSKIQSIPGDLFKNNQKLKIIIFTHNQLLTRVGESLFENLEQLSVVQFNNNKCNIEFIDDPENIQLSKNKFTLKCS